MSTEDLKDELTATDSTAENVDEEVSVEESGDMDQDTDEEFEDFEGDTGEANNAFVGIGTNEESPKKKRGLKFKILLVVIIVVAILGIAGASVYLIFHDDPRFCAAVCHDPMDPYLASYTDGTSVNKKQANITDQIGITQHIELTEAEADMDTIVCVDCHDDGLNVQMAEGFAWATGSFKNRNTPDYAGNNDDDPYNDVDPNHISSVELHISSTEGVGDRYGVEFCLRPGCHVDDAGNPIEDVQSLQSAMAKDQFDGGINPHSMPAPSAIDSMQHEKYYVEGGLLDCGNCHQMHEQSTLICTECHSEGLDGGARIAAVPDGWLTFQEKVKQDLGR